MAVTTLQRIPDFPLSCYVDRLWYTHAPAPYAREKILPAPHVDLMINFGDPFQAYEADAQRPSIACTDGWWVGLQRQARIVAFPANPHILSVSFKPGGAYPFLQLPLSELQDQVVSWDVLWGRFAAEIYGRLLHVPTVPERINLLERLLLAHLGAEPPEWAAVQFAVNAIAQHRGALSIRALSHEVGMSQKHLITQFKRIIGISPKLLARLYRLQHLLSSIDPTQPVDWAALAHQLAYHDQSHFSKDLKAFIGLSPGDYLRQRRQVLATSPEYAQHLRHLPTG